MYWYDVIITFSLSLVLFLVIGSVINLFLKLTDKRHWFGTALISVAFAAIAAFVFTI